MNAQETFSKIYTSGLWSTNHWDSGPGSDPAKEGKDYCLIIPAVLKAMGARRVVDLGCGDGRIMANVADQCPAIDFVGVDACPEVIQSCKASWPQYRWETIDIENHENAEALPRWEYKYVGFTHFRQADVYLMKDVFHHWPTAMISRLLHTLDMRCINLIATQDSHKPSASDDISDGCELGGYRSLDENSFPFNAYDPVVLARYLHKTILLFRFE